MLNKVRMTHTTQAVLAALLEDPTAPRYGFDIAQYAGIATGSLYPILARLEALGVVESYWEQQEQQIEGRPRRRYYKLTEDGAVSARQALARSHRSPSRSWRTANGVA
ncbi:PadR family transcriptional regulator [Catellatospora tritici]|uniref:PadR family transcriptional regulator n=1 Tax=Catellatospora tritici TaxID=2851566 RepID=UPI001C2CF1DB|nr:PadR family transcriptional regulator [Catellatospora tritici]MBV1852037.1 PadR family transcriptional regulator [Catellatospora tritici]